MTDKVTPQRALATALKITRLAPRCARAEINGSRTTIETAENVLDLIVSALSAYDAHRTLREAGVKALAALEWYGTNYGRSFATEPLRAALLACEAAEKGAS